MRHRKTADGRFRDCILDVSCRLIRRVVVCGAGGVMKRFLTAIFLSVSMSAPVASGELYDCDGTWTNKPCAGSPARVLPESEATIDLDGEALKKKRDLVSGLRNRADSASFNWKVTLDLTGIAESCTYENTTYEDCLNLVNNADDRLQTRINEAKQIREQERTNRLLEESNRLKISDQSGQQAVSVTQDNSVVIVDQDIHRRQEPKEREASHPAPRDRHHRPRPENTPMTKKRSAGALGPGLQVRN